MSPVTKGVMQIVAEAEAEVEALSMDEARAAVRSGALLVDLRDVRELRREGKIPGAYHAPRGMLEFWADPASPYYRDYFQEERRTVLFCAGGGRSVLATLALQRMGFKRVAHLEPGFGGWQKADAPVEDVQSTSRWIRRPKV